MKSSMNKHYTKINNLCKFHITPLHRFGEFDHYNIQPVCIYLDISASIYSDFWCECVLYWRKQANKISAKIDLSFGRKNPLSPTTICLLSQYQCIHLLWFFCVEMYYFEGNKHPFNLKSIFHLVWNSIVAYNHLSFISRIVHPLDLIFYRCFFLCESTAISFIDLILEGWHDLVYHVIQP